MSRKNTAWGNKAYKEVIKSGGTKEQAKLACKEANDKYYNYVRENQFGRLKSYDDTLYDFNNSKNDGSWHTSDDI